MISKVENIDCMLGMAQFPDKYFELAICDPPYGLGDRTMNGGGGACTQSEKFKSHIKKGWDNIKPTEAYFIELVRISKNQIIWGGNYFGLPAHRCFIVWDKMTYIPTFSQVEQAWTSFDSPARLIKINSNQSDRLHPAQKPVKLYKWLLTHYAKAGDKILDTHLGSGSSRIAAHDLGFDFWGYELDKDYYQAATKRFKLVTSQTAINLE